MNILNVRQGVGIDFEFVSYPSMRIDDDDSVSYGMTSGFVVRLPFLLWTSIWPVGEWTEESNDD